METTVLKNFATAARTQLIKEVAARLDIVVQDSSSARREFGAAMAELDKAIQTEGGGAAGQRKVAERVAYTWFNRIIALRFMDANHYFDVSIVSPSAGQTAGQPEVLADAKRGHIDTQVVISKVTVDRIAGLLNGTVRSDDPQREAYGLLLAAYCQAQYEAMPFMFERDGDYTELLMPADLLSDESVIAKAVKVLTLEVCQDVEVVGWLYQFYIAERKDEVFAGFGKGKKAGAAEIPAATQLFTPHWIVRYLVENSLGRLWLLNHPDSMLAEHMDYYIAPVEPETDFLKINSLEELKILDPACGSGHMLTYAFDLLYAIYEEEGYAPNEIPDLILTNNLYGTEIDPRAGALAAFALTMKARAKQRTFLSKAVVPNICVFEPIRFTEDELKTLVSADGDPTNEEKFFNQFADADTFGSLIRPKEKLIGGILLKLSTIGDTDLFVADILSRASRVLMQAEYLSSRYHVVVANPPYMGSRNMSAKLGEWLRVSYQNSKSDLMTAFMERAIELCLFGGSWGMINLPSWMFLSSFESLRDYLLRVNRIASLVHLGRGVFGSDFGSVAFVADNAPRAEGGPGVYRRLFEEQGKVRTNSVIESLFLKTDYRRFVRDQSDFKKIPGQPIAYWLSDRMLAVFDSAQTLAELAEVKHGLSTGKNSAVVRLWSEVSAGDLGLGMASRDLALSSGKKWFPYNKGGDFRKWFGNAEYVLRYDQYGTDLMASFSGHRHDGKSHYFLPGITWTFISTSNFAARFTPHGFIFDVSGSSLFVHRPAQVLAFMCTNLCFQILQALNPTLNFQVGNIKSLPILPRVFNEIGERVEGLAARIINLHKQDWDSVETSWDFTRHGLLPDRPGQRRIEDEYARFSRDWNSVVLLVRSLECANNEIFNIAYGVEEEITSEVPVEAVTLKRSTLRLDEVLREYVSYAVGCMFGRYSLDKTGLILAKPGDTVKEYLAQVSDPSFEPDKDNVIPILGDDWFADDIVERFRKFLRVTFGDEHFEENLRFIEEALGKDIRKYFVTDFYKDHVQRYKKRPIYWLFSSPKGSFNALIYMHRYMPSTVGTVLNEYLREFQAKLGAALEYQQRISDEPSISARDKARVDKEIDKLRNVLQEVRDYERDVLYPLATRQITIDLDDGVKVNYPKFGVALKKIPGLEATSD